VTIHELWGAMAWETSVGGWEGEPPLRSFHNLFVIFILGVVCLWAGKVAFQLYRALEIHYRLYYHQALQLGGMSLYANDFQLLIRQHFNQIVRIRRAVPPKPVTRHALSVHIQPNTIAITQGDVAAHLGVRFMVDTLAPCWVNLFWGVPMNACNDLVQRHLAHGGAGGAFLDRITSRGWRRGWQSPAQEAARSLLEMETMHGVGTERRGEDGDHFLPEQYVEHSRGVLLPAGINEEYATPAGDMVDFSSFTFDVTGKDDSSIIPLVILCLAQRRPVRELGCVDGVNVVEAEGQLTLVKFRPSDGTYVPEVFRQICFGEHGSNEIQGVYGFEDEGVECQICFAKTKNVLLLPCRHCSFCHPCLRSLREEKCPLCRRAYAAYITLPIAREDTVSGGDDAQPSVAPPREGSRANTSSANGHGGEGGRRGGGDASSVLAQAEDGDEVVGHGSHQSVLLRLGAGASCDAVPTTRTDAERADTEGGRWGGSRHAVAPSDAQRQELPRSRGGVPATRMPAPLFSGRGSSAANAADSAETPLLQESSADTVANRRMRNPVSSAAGVDALNDETVVLLDPHESV